MGSYGSYMADQSEKAEAECTALRTALQVAEGKLEKAREALKWITNRWDNDTGKTSWNDQTDYKAREALAAIEETK